MVLPASGWDIIANVRLRFISSQNSKTIPPIFAKTDKIDFDKKPTFDSEIILKVGDAKKLVLPEYTEQSAVWTSEDEAIASVDEDGVVTANSLGEAKIIADTNDGYKTEYTVNVYSTVAYYWHFVMDFCEENWIAVVIVAVVAIVFIFIKASF